MKINSFSLKLILFALLQSTLSCNSNNDIKRKVCYNFYLGSTQTEFDNELKNYFSKNNNRMFDMHETQKGEKYYSSIIILFNSF